MDENINDNADYEHLLGDLNIASARLHAQTAAKQSRKEPSSSDDESDLNSGSSDNQQESEAGSQDASSGEEDSSDYEDGDQSPGSEDVDDYLQNYMEQAALQSLLQNVHGADAGYQLANQLYAASIASSGASPATTFLRSMSHFMPHEPDEIPNKHPPRAGNGQSTGQASIPQGQQANQQEEHTELTEATTGSQLPKEQQHSKHKSVTFLDTIEEEEDQQADDNFEWFEELPKGAPLPKGRLGILYAALAANRQLNQYIKDVVAARVEKAIDDNWTHMMAVRAAPETMKSTRQHTKTSVRSRFHADPLRKALGPGGQTNDLRPTRFWIVDGEAPEPNEDTLQLSAQLSGLPATYERARWSKSLTAALKRGVQAEVQAHLTEQALQEAQASLTAQESGQHAAGGDIQLADLTQRFKEIQAIEPDSEEGYRLSSLLTDEQWARVSAAQVIEKSAVDCKHHWLYIVRPSRPWSSEENAQLHKLVQELGKHNWDAVAQRLNTGRTAVQCLQAYIKTARPEGHATKGRSLWSPEDTAMLEQLVAKHGTQWVKISAEFGGKYDRHQLRDRWHGQAAHRTSRKVGRWSPDEDQKLQEAIQAHGLKWRPVSTYVGTRTPQQCRERYDNIFKPTITHGPWSDEEQNKLKEAIQKVLDENGRIVWSKVSALMVKRTDDMCKRAWRQLQEAGTIITRNTTNVPQLTLPKKQPKAASAQRRRGGGKKRRRKESSSEEDEHISESSTDNDDHDVEEHEPDNDEPERHTPQQQDSQRRVGRRSTSCRGRGTNRGRGRGRGRAVSSLAETQPDVSIAGADNQAGPSSLAVPSLAITLPRPGELEASTSLQAATVTLPQAISNTTSPAATGQTTHHNGMEEQGLYAQLHKQQAEVRAVISQTCSRQAGEGMHEDQGMTSAIKRTRRRPTRLADEDEGIVRARTSRGRNKPE